MQPIQGALTNDDVVRLVKSGRSGDYIVASIRHAPGTRFDLSAGEVLKLKREGVRGDVLRAMKEAQRGPQYGLSVRRHAFLSVALILMWVPIAVFAATAAR
jgi:hypothetical protein